MSKLTEKAWYQRQLVRRRERYHSDEEYRKRQNEITRRWKEGKKNDPEWKAHEKARRSEWYRKRKELKTEENVRRTIHQGD